MDINEEKKITVGRTPNAKVRNNACLGGIGGSDGNCCRLRTKPAPSSTKPRIILINMPMLSNTKRPGVVHKMMAARKNWSVIPETTSRHDTLLLDELISQARLTSTHKPNALVNRSKTYLLFLDG
jgi:hypothetical protein